MKLLKLIFVAIFQKINLFQKTILDSTSPNSFATSTMPMMQHIGEFTLRDGNRYLDIKTNLITGSAMLSFYYWGYLYNSATCFGHAGCYPYDGTTIINKYMYNTGATILTNIVNVVLSDIPNYCIYLFIYPTEKYIASYFINI